MTLEVMDGDGRGCMGGGVPLDVPVTHLRKLSKEGREDSQLYSFLSAVLLTAAADHRGPPGAADIYQVVGA
jgi:hypothetical protein